jgi:hypothetical protein
MPLPDKSLATYYLYLATTVLLLLQLLLTVLDPLLHDGHARRRRGWGRGAWR